MTRFELPDVSDLVRLGERHEYAITVYAETAPGPNERDKSQLTAKSAVDRALRTIREAGARHAVEAQLRSRWAEIAEADLWRSLSRSVAIFIADDFHEVYVLPNALESQLQVGNYFDIGQLVRAVTTPQAAYALTLSADGWNLWRATATTRAQEFELTGEYARDVAEATNRATVRDRGHVRRLVGDEGKKVLLETYAKRVAEAVDSELGQADPSQTRPLFLFAADPLLDMYQRIDQKRRIVAVPGAADELRPDQIDTAIRRSLGGLNAARANALVENLADGLNKGLVATDLGDIARAATAGAVDTLVYDFTVDILGSMDPSSGALTFADDGYDLLSRVAVKVLEHGGDAVAVRSDEISAGVWNGTAVAKLRYAPG